MSEGQPAEKQIVSVGAALPWQRQRQQHFHGHGERGGLRPKRNLDFANHRFHHGLSVASHRARATWPVSYPSITSA
jgi:hypothetical protein